MSNFITDCINGDALLSDIDDYIDEWHEGDSELPLNQFLGMTESEYQLFVQDESYLASIVTAHRDKRSVKTIIKEQLAMAARSDNPAKAKRLERWLKDEGLWD